MELLALWVIGMFLAWGMLTVFDDEPHFPTSKFVLLVCLSWYTIGVSVGILIKKIEGWLQK